MSDQELYRLHSVIPENFKTSYEQYDIVDFVLPFETRAIQLNTIRIIADLDTQLDGASLDTLGAYFLNNHAGAHSVIDTITTNTMLGQLENFVNYPRYVAMKTSATKDPNELLEASNVCELKSPLAKFTNFTLRGEQSAELDGAGIKASAVKEICNFSLKPNFCLNTAQAVGGGLPLISHTKSGNIRVSIRLARNEDVLWGSSTTATNNNYSLKNLHLTFVSRPDANVPKSINMETKTSLKQSLQSDAANIQAVVPAVCKSVSCSFMPQDREHTTLYDNLQQYRLPNLSQLQFIWNDSTNAMITYIIKNQPETIERYLNSFNYMGMNDANPVALQSNMGYGVGLDFGEYVNLASQKFQIQMNTTIGSENTSGYGNFIAFLYFHGIITF
tara:strand:- start:769 stop:1932 length:1164 start_codon:yes stop_codon:yes gene_type:complete